MKQEQELDMDMELDEWAWEQAMKRTHEKNTWINHIHDELAELSKTRTGNMILQLIASLWKRGEITITNENPTSLSANVFTNQINIPSVPRHICYPTEQAGLQASQLWIVLGHELLHLVHKRLGLHDLINTQEEENTVQGRLDDVNYQDLGVVKINGDMWHLTENEFRKEYHTPDRTGYMSLPICTIFDKRGCRLFNHYSNSTCSLIEGGNPPDPPDGR